MAICSATTACASKNASLTSGLRSVEKLSPTIGTTKQPFTRILPLSQRVAHAHCLSRVQHAAEIGFRVETVELRGGDQGGDRRGTLAAGVGSGEQPVLPAKGRRPAARRGTRRDA